MLSSLYSADPDVASPAKLEGWADWSRPGPGPGRCCGRYLRSTRRVTVTDSQGHAIGHGSEAPATPRNRHQQNMPRGPDPPGKPRFTLTPGSYPDPRWNADRFPDGSVR
jgi:hypothetical protein